MSAMPRPALSAVLVAAILHLVSLLTPHAQGQDVQRYLRDQYVGKTFVLRGFPSGDALHYDSSGASDRASSGDWTTDGFVRVNDIHLSDDRLIIKGQRMAAGFTKQFELRPLERSKKRHFGKEAAILEISADPGMHNPSADQVDAVVSKIFLTAQDTFADAVPDYWKLCVSRGLQGTDKNCAFAPAFRTIPGFEVQSTSGNSVTPGFDTESNDGQPGIHSVRKGVRPPRVTYQHEPEFSEAARVAKYQGTVTLSLVVNKEGAPTNIRVSQPLGYGLDARAVRAVEGWKFTPAEKDGEPVPVYIAIEVDFHLY